VIEESESRAFRVDGRLRFLEAHFCLVKDNVWNAQLYRARDSGAKGRTLVRGRHLEFGGHAVSRTHGQDERSWLHS
jgi:hypothetical protein